MSLKGATRYNISMDKKELFKTLPNGQWQLLEKAIWEHAPHITPDKCTCRGGYKKDEHHYTCVDKNPLPLPYSGRPKDWDLRKPNESKQEHFLRLINGFGGDPPDEEMKPIRLSPNKLRVPFDQGGVSPKDFQEDIEQSGGRMTASGDDYFEVEHDDD